MVFDILENILPVLATMVGDFSDGSPLDFGDMSKDFVGWEQTIRTKTWFKIIAQGRMMLKVLKRASEVTELCDELHSRPKYANICIQIAGYVWIKEPDEESKMTFYITDHFAISAGENPESALNAWVKLVRIQYVNGEARTDDNLKYLTMTLEAMIRQEGKIEAENFDFCLAQTIKVTYMGTPGVRFLSVPSNDQ